MVFVQYHNIGYHIGYLTEIRLYLSVKADHSNFTIILYIIGGC